MSINVGTRSLDRGKKSPSQKNSSSKCGASIKTETSKRGSNSCFSVPTIDKYFIKVSATEGVKRANNNNQCESKTKSFAESEIPKNNSERTVGVSLSKPELVKENTPVPEFNDVDDSVSDLDFSVAENSDSNRLESDTSDPGNKADGKGKLSPITSIGEKKEPQVSTDKLQVDDGDGTDELQTENESETQEHDVDSVEDTQAYVEYKEEDFNTDSDFEKSDLDTESKEPEDFQEDKNGKSIVASGSGSKEKNTAIGSFISSKIKNTAMGGIFSRSSKRSRQENCQGSSSEEETERPWRPKSSSREQRVRPYPLRSPRLTPLRRQWSDHDTQLYRAGYPDKKDNPNLNLNAQFYLGQIPSRPDGARIDDIHRHWWNNHDRLESHHGYIQWLFPIRESGMNFQAQELQPHEAKTIQNDETAMKRFRRSYEMMLYFYGIKLVDHRTGEVARAENWKTRFKHLNHSMHNYLRITRILKSLGEMGLEHYKVPLLEFMLHEATKTRQLDRTLDSCYNYWIGTVRSDRHRELLKRRAEAGGQRMSAR
ncbi:uncharacterized protein LOC143300955 [Babylonia areolata]|uniref:uncharacterized protein LOC143300955 n=1 Tax=Babylonia areolata TaxID=304850 RepID=UPI003FCF4BFB